VDVDVDVDVDAVARDDAAELTPDVVLAPRPGAAPLPATEDAVPLPTRGTHSGFCARVCSPLFVFTRRCGSASSPRNATRMSCARPALRSSAC
jgi:hypothetical protein